MDTSKATLGTENLRTAIIFAVGLTMQTFKVMEDGKFSPITDGVQFVDEALQVPGFAKALPKVKAELQDLDETERAELMTFFANKFDIPNDKVEAVVEKSLNFALLAHDLLADWKEIL